MPVDKFILSPVAWPEGVSPQFLETSATSNIAVLYADTTPEGFASLLTWIHANRARYHEIYRWKVPYSINSMTPLDFWCTADTSHVVGVLSGIAPDATFEYERIELEEWPHAPYPPPVFTPTLECMRYIAEELANAFFTPHLMHEGGMSLLQWRMCELVQERKAQEQRMRVSHSRSLEQLAGELMYQYKVPGAQRILEHCCPSVVHVRDTGMPHTRFHPGMDRIEFTKFSGKLPQFAGVTHSDLMKPLVERCEGKEFPLVLGGTAVFKYFWIYETYIRGVDEPTITATLSSTTLPALLEHWFDEGKRRVKKQRLTTLTEHARTGDTLRRKYSQFVGKLRHGPELARFVLLDPDMQRAEITRTYNVDDPEAFFDLPLRMLLRRGMIGKDDVVADEKQFCEELGEPIVGTRRLLTKLNQLTSRYAELDLAGEFKKILLDDSLGYPGKPV